MTTLPPYEQLTFPLQICGQVVSPAKMSALHQARDKGLPVSALACFIHLRNLFESRSVNLDGYSLKTLKAYLALIEDETSPEYSLSWTNAGTMQTGKLSTQNSTFPKTENEYSLLDFLEKTPDPKYYVKTKDTFKILNALTEIEHRKFLSLLVDSCKIPLPEVKLTEIVSGTQGERVYSPFGLSCTLTSSAGGIGGKTGLYFDITLIDYSQNNPQLTTTARCLTTRYDNGISKISADKSAVLSVAPILNANRVVKRQNGSRIKDPNSSMFTLTASDLHGVVEVGYNGELFSVAIRRLTPRECFRLQGFSDVQFDVINETQINGKKISDTQLYKMAGNAVTIPVVKYIGETLSE